MKLTLSQKKAVGSLGKHTLISAGAGTGKTRVLVERVFHLVTQHAVPLAEILVMTFTEKAAGEIKQRLSKRFQKENCSQARQDLESASISTFHSFAARLLREHPVEAGVDPEFRVFENEESELLKEEALDDCMTRFFESNHPAFGFFESYGEFAAREALLHLYHTARQEGLGVAAYFPKWKEQRKLQMNEFREQILMLAESRVASIAEHLDVEAWRQWIQKGLLCWQDVESFDAWFSSYKRSPQKNIQEQWTAWKQFVEEWLAFQIESFSDEMIDFFEKAACDFELVYSQKKNDQNGLDFDDLQVRAVELLRENSSGARIVLSALRRQFRHIFVDEFQDTSYLQMEFVQFLMASAEVFLVGDYKQSIYAFRGAEPRLFLETQDAFQASEAATCIALADNFRSRSSVLHFVNTFFARLWEEDGFPFDPLIMKKEEPTQIVGTRDDLADKPELMIIPTSDEGGKEEARLREGSAIASRIQELNAQGIAYGDMAVLFSAMTHSALYEYALRRAGVPYVSVSGMSFYDQSEIRDLISLLECLQNPLADVPLASLLRSPFVRVSDETLFWIAEKAKSKKAENPLCEGLSAFLEIEEISDSEKKKLESFWNHFQNWRQFKDANRLSDLLEEAVEKTGYVIWALAQPSGVRRYGHIRKFIQLARRQEGRGKLSIHSFLALVRRLQFQEVRETDPAASGEDIQAVRLMTVHAAKGLEFPIVFLADLGRSRNPQHGHPSLAVPHFGFALRVKNPATGKNEAGWMFQKLQEIRKKQENEERKRLFYVAATRAENNLILSGVWNPPKNEKETYAEMSSWMSWVMRSRDLLEERLPQAAIGEQPPSLMGAYSEKPQFQVLLKDVLEEKDEVASAATDLPEAATQVLNRMQSIRKPEFSKVIDLPVSAYVLFSKDPEQFWSVYGRGWSLPEWDSFEQISAESGARSEDAADFGTRMHRALEFIDWTRPENSLATVHLDKMFVGFSEARRSEASRILSEFFETELFQEVRNSKIVRRELDFVLNARRGLIDGVIDLLFQNPDGSYTVLDYKTAEGDAAKVAKQGYDLQIQIYALAASKILKQPVSRGQVYFLKNHCAVDVPLDDFARIESNVNEIQSRLLEFVKSRY